MKSINLKTNKTINKGHICKKKITKLYITHKKLSQIKGLNLYINLQHLSLCHNLLKNQQELLKIPSKHLKKLSIEGNPFCKNPFIFEYILKHFPNLNYINQYKMDQLKQYQYKIDQFSNVLVNWLAAIIFERQQIQELTANKNSKQQNNFQYLNRISEIYSDRLIQFTDTFRYLNKPKTSKFFNDLLDHFRKFQIRKFQSQWYKKISKDYYRTIIKKMKELAIWALQTIGGNQQEIENQSYLQKMEKAIIIFIQNKFLENYLCCKQNFIAVFPLCKKYILILSNILKTQIKFNIQLINRSLSSIKKNFQIKNLSQHQNQLFQTQQHSLDIQLEFNNLKTNLLQYKQQKIIDNQNILFKDVSSKTFSTNNFSRKIFQTSNLIQLDVNNKIIKTQDIQNDQFQNKSQLIAFIKEKEQQYTFNILSIFDTILQNNIKNNQAYFLNQLQGICLLDKQYQLLVKKICNIFNNNQLNNKYQSFKNIKQLITKQQYLCQKKRKIIQNILSKKDRIYKKQLKLSILRWRTLSSKTNKLIQYYEKKLNKYQYKRFPQKKNIRYFYILGKF